ncbi:MAG: ATP-dependent Clp protease ATP-binding subunit [Minisyncoccia bacterium]
MSYLEPRKPRLYRAVITAAVFPTPVARMVARISAIVALLFFVLWFFRVSSAPTWTLAVTAAAVAYLSKLYDFFIRTYLSSGPTPAAGEENLAEYLDYEALRIVNASVLKEPTALLLPMISAPGMGYVLARLGTVPQNFKHDVQAYLQKPVGPSNPDALSQFIYACLSKEGGSRILSWQDLFLGLCVESPFLKQFILDRKLDVKEIALLLDWEKEIAEREETRSAFWRRENLMRTRSIGQSWSSGYTPHLEQYAADVGFGDADSPRLYGRQVETEAIERVLARDGRNNVILVGEPGVGKKVVVTTLAQRIALGETLPALAHKRVLNLEVSTLANGVKSNHELEARLQTLLNEAVMAGNIILFIDNIHTLFSTTEAAGALDATAVLLPFLNSAHLQVIGLTTHEGFHEMIAKHPELTHLFEKVEAHEPTKEEAYAILRDAVPHIEAHDKVWIPFQAISAAVELSDRYIKNMPFPEKAIDLLQEAAVFASTKANSSVVTEEHIEAVVHQKTAIPVGQVNADERQILLQLEDSLHARVIGQDEAITTISNALRRVRSGLSSAKRPIGSFLFLGPTGVGKTETAKALAAIYFGSEERMIRFDMSEYQQADSVERLIGGASGRGILTTAIMDNPFSLVLLDELEKAEPNILNIFLQVLDDGRLTDALGRTVDFTNTLILATSNAGAELIRESVGSGETEAALKERILDAIQKEGIFHPEFLNRFDAIIMFKPLTESEVGQVAKLFIDDLNRRLEEKSITVVADAAVLQKLASEGFDKEFGARPLRHLVQEKVENLVAKKLLSGELASGQTLVLTPEEI